MREKIKKIFLNSNHSFISGEDLSKQLKISRAAIWKQIEELKKEGYEFEAVRRKGYRLLNRPDDILLDEIKSNLNTEWLGREIVYSKETKSTQFDAHELARNGAVHGTVVIANKQTGGKGRLGRVWYSEADKGIWMSIILRPSFNYQHAPLITLFTSIVIYETLKSLYEIDAWIKWPNDIYLDGKKSAGILTEMHGEQDQIHYLIIGLGINTHKTKYPADIQSKAISIEENINKPPRRTEIIQQFLNKFEKNYEYFIDHGFEPFYEKYNQRLFGKGKKITIKQINRTYKGYIDCIDKNGYLMVKNENGEQTKVIAGDIEF